MKNLALIISAIWLSITSMADNYKILQMNTPYVKIGNQICKTGDVFPDAEPILWSNDNQAIKAMNLKTKQIKLFAAKVFQNLEAKSIKDYYLKNNHLSTRGGINTFSDLAEELSDTIYLYDVVQVESPVKIDSLSSYLISYVQNGEKKWRTLMSTDEHFFFSRELFGEDIDSNEFTITLYFRKKEMEYFIISDSVEVVVLPLEMYNPNGR